jgi:N-acetylmuramoyl-L-alanine amidase
MLARPLSSSAPRSRTLAAGLLLLACAGSLHAARRHPVLSPFDRAQQMRDALEALPEEQRTRADYAQLLEAYRIVYHRNPGDPKAQQSIDTVAVLLAEEGRIFRSEKTLHDAIAQCEFLRAQYPGGPFRSSALLMEASISLHDLHDRDAAKTAYQRFLRDFPDDPLASQARAGLKEARHPGRQSDAPPQFAQGLPANDTAPQPNDTAPPATGRNTRRSTVLDAARSSQSEQAARAAATAPPTLQPHPPPAHENELSRLDTSSATVTNQPEGPPIRGATPSAASAAAGQPVLTGATRVAAQQHRGRLPLVTNVRHWSTPVYTRVAIDLQDQVEYEAARVPNPDRIYFDLHGAKVAPELIGRSVDVTDDGFLQRIRVAQFSNDVTRVVLDVSQVSEYSAFFLPNPWRLIIDIHGARPGSRPAANAPGPPVQIAATPAPMAAARQPQPVPASSQPGTQSAKALHDIASLGNTPDKVQATRKPTTQPIAASVPGRPRERASTPVTVVDDGPGDDDPSAAATNTARAPETRPQPLPSSAGSAHKTTRTMHSDDVVGDEKALGDKDAVSPNAHDRPREGTRPTTPETTPQTPREASREAASIDGQRSLTRALGLKIGRIVVDAGHGGHDSGTLGPGGIAEKTVVLDVALRLGKLLRQRMGAEVTYTRDDDTFIPLETRTAIANKAQADLFISVHANSSPDPTARGVETYYLNFTTSPDALEVAARENAVSDQSVHELSGLVKKITLKDKIDESRTFAADVQQSLYTGLEQGNPGLRDRGVKKAPFVVLIGANMPSILAEISFLTNPGDATELRDPAYRQRIAESLYRGVAHYVSGLSGLRVAQANSIPRGN